MQYINDGIETDKYFPQGTTPVTNVTEQEALVNEGQAKFVIKLAADGSVYLIPVGDTNSFIASILNENTKSVVDATYKASIDECQYTTPSSVYAWPSTSTQQDWLLNTEKYDAVKPVFEEKDYGLGKHYIYSRNHL